MMDIEKQIKGQLGNIRQDNSYIDKVLGKEEIRFLREIQSKPIFDREDIDQLQLLMNNGELKLLNLSDQRRYIHNKYYCWVEESLKMYKMYLDYKSTEEFSALDTQTQKLYSDHLMITTNVVKQFVFLYFHLARSTLSIEGWGIGKLLTQVIDYIYKQDSKQTIVEPEKKKFFGIG